MGKRAEAKRDHIERVIRFPQPLYERLREKAAENERSIQWVVIAELQRNIPEPEEAEA